MRAVVIDSSPLIIHLVGSFDIKLVEKVAVCKQPEDEFRCIDRLFSIYSSIFITPYVLGEVFWLVKSRLGKRGKEVKELFSRYKEVLFKFGEVSIKKDEILNFRNPEFGMVDASLFLAAKKMNCPILTSDSRFAQFSMGHGIEVTNFIEHLFE